MIFLWQYNYGPELAHYGILGMKWGRRRYQNKNGTLTPAGKKRYSASKTDQLVFGNKGAQRIADRRNKGDSYKKAAAKEFGRQFATSLAIGALSMAGFYALTSGQAGKLVNAGKKAIDSYMNISVLDSDGNVLTRYHEAVKVGEAVAGALIKKR